MNQKVFALVLLLGLTGCVSTSTLEEHPKRVVHHRTPLTDMSPESATKRHNEIRSEVFTGAKMIWSSSIANSAQKYAHYLASSGKFDHDRNSGYGENLYTASVDVGYVEAINSWYAEKSSYNYSSNRCTDGECRHYTQMIWKKSTELGCGKSTYKRGRYKGWSVIVCRYAPAGNYVGYRPY
jgi:pathogenesis-related protein 1